MLLPALALTLCPVAESSAATSSVPVSAPPSPTSVVVLAAGFGSSLPASTYQPMAGGSAALSAIEQAFDPTPTAEPPGCRATPNLTTALVDRGAVIIPFSYGGAQLSGPSQNPTLRISAYPSSAASTILPQAGARTLLSEITQLHGTWPRARIVVVGHSEGGYVAEQYFASLFDRRRAPEVRGIYSLDSPINGVRNVPLVSALLTRIHFPASQALLHQFGRSWLGAASTDAAVLAKDRDRLYVPVGTPGDNVYRIADQPSPGITSQVLVGQGGRPLATTNSPNFFNPANPPVAGIGNPAALVASHQCVMGNASVISAIGARVAP